MGRGSGEIPGDNEPDVRPRKESNGEETTELIERQERLLDRLRDAPPAETRDLAVGLGQAMRRVAADERLWDELERAGARATEAGPSKYLALADWETLLRDWNLSDVELAALELIDAVDRGVSEPPEWGRIRELVHQLGSEISNEAVDVAERRGRWGRLKERMSVGVSALRRVRLSKKLLVRSGAGAATGAAPILVGVLLGAPLGPVGALVGAAVCGLVAGGGSEVYAALNRPPEEDRSALEDLFKNPELHPAGEGRARADLRTIEVVLSEVSGETCEAAIAEPLAKLRLWAARVGARLLSSWPVVQARLGGAIVREVEWTLDASVALQQTLRIVATLCATAADGVRTVLDASFRQIGDVGSRLRQLDGILASQGFGGHNA